MNSMDVDVLRTALAWLAAGRRVTLGTVVHTWGSSPRPPGSLMIIRDDGQVAGSLSGGCIEDDLVERVRRGELAGDLPRATLYGASAEEARRFGLPCGGSVQIVLEPLGAQSMIEPLLREVERHRVVRRTLAMATGAVRLDDGRDGDVVHFDGQALQTVHGPRLRLVIIGAGQLSRYLAEMATMLDYRDPNLDDLALMEALKTPAFYVAALGSRRNNAARRERLREFDVSAEQAAALHGPAGLNLGGKTPPEIALAIVAEMTALHRGVPVAGALADWSGSTTACRVAV